MMKIFRFREWPVYQEALNFRKWMTENIVPLIPKEERYELTSQLKRALNSVILNIAEGAYRISDKDFAHFLNNSVTSLNEVVACFDICLKEKYIGKNLHAKAITLSNDLAKQLIAFHKSLLNHKF